MSRVEEIKSTLSDEEVGMIMVAFCMAAYGPSGVVLQFRGSRFIRLAPAVRGVR
jgi:hypothetical protein